MGAEFCNESKFIIIADGLGKLRPSLGKIKLFLVVRFKYLITTFFLASLRLRKFP